MSISSKKNRDIVRSVSREQFVTKLRRLADAIEADDQFVISVQGERVRIPRSATVSIEHEREGNEEEVEFQVRWTNKTGPPHRKQAKSRVRKSSG